MAIAVTHVKVSSISDDPAAAAAGEVLPSDWNAEHALVGVLPFEFGGTGAATASAAQANLLSYTSTASNGLATTGASGAAGIATLTFATQASPPFAVGSYIAVAGITPTGYAGMYQVTACTTGSVSYANATTGAQTVAGNVTTAWPLTNASSFYQIITGTTFGAFSLPDTSTLQQGWSFRINNAISTTLNIYSSTGVSIASLAGGSTGYLTCINTALNTAAAWRFGVTEVSSASGTGSMVLSSGPVIVGTLSFNGTNTSASNFHTTQTSGLLTIGGAAATGLMTIGRSTATQTTSIQDGVTASGSTKTITMGTGGALGSTTNITFGSATSGATSNTNVNGALKVGTNLANYVQAVGAATTFSPVLSSQGSDINIDLTLTPKGTGRVNITTSIKPKVNSAANVTSPLAWDSTSYDEYAITALANALTINADANASPADGQKMMFRFKDNGTPRALTWTTGSTNSFRLVGVTLPTTTVANKLVYIGCIYNAADSRWDAVAVSQEA